VEVEISPKKAETYRKIFRVYDKDKKITDIFYLCGDPSIFRKIKDLSFGTTDKTYWFVLLSELMHFKADTLLHSHSKKSTLKELLGAVVGSDSRKHVTYFQNYGYEQTLAPSSIASSIIEGKA